MRAQLQRRLIDQFHRPHGLLGRLAGRIMARRASNLERNRWTVELLGLAPAERVLELGPGPGVTLALLLERVGEGRVVGVDHSKTMLAQCARRNRAALATGHLTLIEGGFTALPELPGPFDAILAVNSLQFEGLGHDTLAAIASYLAPGGRIAITFQPRGAHPTEAKARAFAAELVERLEAIGLPETRIEFLPMEPVGAVCVMARKRGSDRSAGDSRMDPPAAE